MKNYLFHHGIRGQKWGVRNGPPYPLSPFNPKVRARRRQERKLRDLTEQEYMPGWYFTKKLFKTSAKEVSKKYVDLYKKVAEETGTSIFDFDEMKKLINVELRKDDEDEEDEE